MNLEDAEVFRKLDPQNMLAEIDNLPSQLESGYRLGGTLELPTVETVRQVVIAGMGGSAIGADLLAAYAAPHCQAPVSVVRGYHLPAWVNGAETVLIGASHSGNTEETLAAFEQAAHQGCQRVALTTGGELAAAAEAGGAALWKFEHRGQPRAAVGYSFGLLLALFTRLGLIPDPAAELAAAARAMRSQQANLQAETHPVNNPAKRQAGQLMGRMVSVFASEHLEPVARRWKGQISELSKAWAQFEALPEANHNTLAGIVHPEALFSNHIALFLVAPSYDARNAQRQELTRHSFMLEGLSTDYYMAPGESRLAEQWTAVHFGDYMAYYLAMAYQIDPTPVEAIENFKRDLQAARQR